jgi:hypothetical protein
MESGIDSARLLGLAEEMAGRAQEEDAGHAALAAHAALVDVPEFQDVGEP